MTEMTQVSVAPARKRRLWDSDAVSHYIAFGASLVCALIIWTSLAWWVGKPAFLPSPRATLDGAIELIRNELDVSMALTGVTTIADIDRRAIAGI